MMTNELNKPGARAVDAMLDVLADEGVSTIFGNPGSTEMPLMDALVERHDLLYVLALQEATAVGMADGYAQATGKAAFVNLHTAGGLGNAMGALVNAMNTNTPLVITAGQQDTRHLFSDPWLAGDLVGIAAPVTKWAYEVRTANDVVPALRRAFSIANTHPRGPVFVSIPMDLLEEKIEIPLLRRGAVPLPTTGDISGLVEWYLSQKKGVRTALLLSDAVVHSDAVAESVAVADALGADVFGTPLVGGNIFPSKHEAWKGVLPPHYGKIREQLEGYDAALLIGDHALLAYPYSEGEPLPRSIKFFQVAIGQGKPGHDAPADIAVSGDPKVTLALLARELSESQKFTAFARTVVTNNQDQELSKTLPLHPRSAVGAVLGVLPEGIPVVNEAPCTFDAVRELWKTNLADRYYFVRGGALGFGMPAAVGVSIAGGHERVVCFIGDGAAMYSPQALWSAARYKAPVKYVVFNNQKYDILMRVAKNLGSTNAVADRFIGMDIQSPAIDFEALAKTVGIPYKKLETFNEIETSLPEIFEDTQSWLVEVSVTGV